MIIQTSDEGVGPQIATREQIEAAEAADHRERVAQLERRARFATYDPFHRVKPPIFLDCVDGGGLLLLLLFFCSLSGSTLIFVLSMWVCSRPVAHCQLFLPCTILT